MHKNTLQTSRKHIASCFSALVFLSSSIALANEGDTRFKIAGFAIEGNSLIDPAEIQQLVAPYTGEGRNYGDIQKALEALESTYRARGFGTVQVYAPEQELTGGTVRLQVTEGKIGKIKIAGNTAFTKENIRASVPQLKEGVPPNMRALSENVQLANENPAKQIELTLGVGERDDEVDATIDVTESNPKKFILTYDNTGNQTTGRTRVGLAFQDANLFGNDEVITLAYTGSPDVWLGHPDGVKVDIYSMAFRLPLYTLGDSIDIIYGNSNVNTPSTQATGFSVIGKGETTSLRYNHIFPRQGEYSSRLIIGLDYKFFNNTSPTFAPGVVGGFTPHTAAPVSATYSGQWVSSGSVADFTVGIAQNQPVGKTWLTADGRLDRYSFIAGRQVSDKFQVFRFGGSYMTALDKWQLRAALSGQYAWSGLIAGEQFSLAGANGVRGFEERAAAADSGELITIEAYTPELAGEASVPGSLRGIFFLDAARGRNIDITAPSLLPSVDGLASWGVGVRYALGKDFSFKLDAAQVLNSDDAGKEGRGDWRGHFSMSYTF